MEKSKIICLKTEPKNLPKLNKTVLIYYYNCWRPAFLHAYKAFRMGAPDTDEKGFQLLYDDNTSTRDHYNASHWQPMLKEPKPGSKGDVVCLITEPNKLPLLGEKVLIFYNEYWRPAKLTEDGFVLIYSGGATSVDIFKPTHWQPMLPKPKEPKPERLTLNDGDFTMNGNLIGWVPVTFTEDDWWYQTRNPQEKTDGKIFNIVKKMFKTGNIDVRSLYTVNKRFSTRVVDVKVVDLEEEVTKDLRSQCTNSKHLNLADKAENKENLISVGFFFNQGKSYVVYGYDKIND